jgi:hypothetical protein
MDVFEKLVKDGGPIGQHMDRAHGYFAFPKLEGELGPHMQFRGKDMIVWSLNNYLGLVNHPEVRKIDGEAATKYGMGNPMGARMMSGNTAMHEELEKVIISAPNRFSANSNETLVLVEFSKNKFAIVISRNAGVFFTGLLSNVLKLSAVSKMV